MTDEEIYLEFDQDPYDTMAYLNSVYREYVVNNPYSCMVSHAEILSYLKMIDGDKKPWEKKDKNRIPIPKGKRNNLQTLENMAGRNKPITGKQGGLVAKIYVEGPVHFHTVHFGKKMITKVLLNSYEV